MCKAVEEYGNALVEERAIPTKIEAIKNLMQNLKLTLDQALQALSISADEQELIRAMIK